MRRYEKPVKPHIYFRGGYWRVTHMPKYSTAKDSQRTAWSEAHAKVIDFNGGYYPGPLDRVERLTNPWSKQNGL